MMKRCIPVLALVATSLFAGVAVADTVGVSRCGQQVSGGVYRSGLLTVEANGTRTFHPVGVNGLTESISFNRTRAFDWMAAQGLFPEGTIFNNYNRYICGMPSEPRD